MRGPTTLAPESTSVNWGAPADRCPRPRAWDRCPAVDVLLPGGPRPHRIGRPARGRAPRPGGRRAPPERAPVLSANQVTMWASPRRLGTRAVEPGPAPLDEDGARDRPALPEETQEHGEGLT
ncbi:hypothetical protein TNCT1_64820 [Streptomyces sp. 1-11]|nr:hypothetical protein TNCT1_64820 [Streptomyces sp. 1-11]